MKESVTYQMIVEEGEAKGFAIGREQGRAEGREQGRAEILQTVIFRLGTSRLGPPDPTVEVAVRAVHDPYRLDHILDRVATASSWQELLNTP